MRILIAEDEPVTRLALARTLKSWGYDVLQAEDGLEAEKILQSDATRMVLTDWMMPGIDGLELCRRIRMLPSGPYTYIILLTSRSDKESLVEGMAAGADDFVSKPFEQEELRARIRAGQRILDLQDELQGNIHRLAELNKTIAQANQRMKEDLDAAAATQRALLPTNPPKLAEARFAWEYRPCTELGGDCLNIFQLDPQHVAMYILDVSGHGVQAALLSVTLSRILLPSQAASSILTVATDDADFPKPASPVEVANLLNKQFPLDTETGQYFTLLYGILDTETGEFRYTTAGQPGPIWLPSGKPPETLEGYELPIGFCDEPEYKEHCLTLEPGDRLYLFTDGVIEAPGMDNEAFGYANLCNALAQNRDSLLSDGLPKLVEQLESWYGSPELPDDVAILAIEMAPAVAVSPNASEQEYSLGRQYH